MSYLWLSSEELLDFCWSNANEILPPEHNAHTCSWSKTNDFSGTMWPGISLKKYSHYLLLTKCYVWESFHLLCACTTIIALCPTIFYKLWERKWDVYIFSAHNVENAQLPKAKLSSGETWRICDIHKMNFIRI